MTSERHHQRPLQERDDDEEKENPVAEERPAAGGKDQLAGPDGERGDDRAGPEDGEPLQRAAGEWVMESSIRVVGVAGLRLAQAAGGGGGVG